MPVSNDLELTRTVRRMLVKHWIDLGRISVRCTSGRIHLFGRLQRIAGKVPELQNMTVDNMLYEMQRIPGVKGVNARLENWIHDSGHWRPFDRHDTKEAQGVSKPRESIDIDNSE
ncbi:MAG: hypothetical protein O3C57_06500 [Verrucomicrobia bacterium]|nr:hypothetical protein [Verrucomicrobiota bacterium]